MLAASTPFSVVEPSPLLSLDLELRAMVLLPMTTAVLPGARLYGVPEMVAAIPGVRVVPAMVMGWPDVSIKGDGRAASVTVVYADWMGRSIVLLPTARALLSCARL